MNIIIMYIYTFYKKDKNIFVNSFIKNLFRKAIYFHYMIFLNSKNKKYFLYFLIIYVFLFLLQIISARIIYLTKKDTNNKILSFRLMNIFVKYMIYNCY